MKQNRQIVINGQSYTYELHLGGVKNYNMRMRPDRTIRVSAPLGARISDIERFIISHSGFIAESEKRIRTREMKVGYPLSFATGEPFMMFGRIYMLNISKSDKIQIALRENTLYISAPNDISVKRAFDKYAFTRLSQVIEPMCDRLYPYFRSRGISRPQIKYRRVKSMWGRCRPKSCDILFNLKLFEVPDYLIIYVVVHEFCHLIIPNHSSDFYKLVSEFLPDYKKRVRLLKQY